MLLSAFDCIIGTVIIAYHDFPDQGFRYGIEDFANGSFFVISRYNDIYNCIILFQILQNFTDVVGASDNFVISTHNYSQLRLYSLIF